MAFHDPIEMFSALQKSEVDIIMIDTYSLGKYKDVLAQKYLKVRKIINTNTGYGFILSGLSSILQTDVESLLLVKSKEVEKFLKEMEEDVPVSFYCLF